MCSLKTIVIFLMCFICLNIVDKSYSETNPVLRTEGIFDKFIRNFLDMLSTACKGKDLIRYCKMMNKELEKKSYKYTHRLANKFRDLSKRHHDSIVDEMAKFRREYDRQLPRQQEFFVLINQAFTLQHNVKFDDYIHALLAFGNGDMLFVDIKDKSKHLLDMILNCVDKMGQKKRKDLVTVLKLAIREYDSASL